MPRPGGAGRAHLHAERQTPTRRNGLTLNAKTEDLPVNESLGEYVLERPAAPDRLPPMLFLAALVHGVLIIGITFNAVLGDALSEAISLEVTIVADPEKSYVEVDKAAYLAQASQQGEGNTRESVRPSAPARSNIPIDNPGVDDGTRLLDASARKETADQVLASHSEQPVKAVDIPRKDPAPDESTAIVLEAGIETTLPLPQDRKATFSVQDENPRQLITSVDTKESNIAGYLDRWKRRIETLGVRYFPEVGVAPGLTGSPTLQVTINASGELDEAIVRQSSGSRILDRAAIGILRRASPFDPFPDEIRADYDQLIFAYKWQFADSGIPATASNR